MSLVIEELATSLGGLVAWIAILLVIVGTALLMRHLSVGGRMPKLRQTVLIVALSTGLLVIAGVGGFALMHGATAAG